MNNKNYIELLKDLISIPSFSGKENKSADRIENWFNENGIRCNRHKNNIYAFNKYYKKDKKTLLVVELKKGRVSDNVVGQIQRYMGYVNNLLH